ncbi:Phage integrase family protein [Rhizobium sp. RU33A]|nr:Phage integrase family protein [Rhizobium sp. RU33A]
MRRGEILGLKWSDISHNRRVITLALTKNGSSREVSLSGNPIRPLGVQG